MTNETVGVDVHKDETATKVVCKYWCQCHERDDLRMMRPIWCWTFSGSTKIRRTRNRDEKTMIDYANFSKQSRVKHLKMRIQIHAKLVANAQIHTHPRHTATHIFAFFSDLSICDLNFSKNTHTNTPTHTCIEARALECDGPGWWIPIIVLSAVSISDWQHYARCMHYPVTCAPTYDEM